MENSLQKYDYIYGAASMVAMRKRNFDDIIVYLFIILVVSTICMPYYFLSRMGWIYHAASANPLTAIHPSTYLGILIYGLIALRHGNALQKVMDDLTAHYAILMFFLACIVVIALSFYANNAFTNRNISTILDTHLSNIFIILIYLNISPSRRKILTNTLHVIMMINAIIGMLELKFGSLAKITDGAPGFLADDDWRSSALMGHPLASATITACYIMALFLKADKNLNLIYRAFFIIIQILAMISFGGRTAALVILLFIICFLTFNFYLILLGKKIRIQNFYFYMLSFCIFSFAIYIFYSLNIIDLFIERFMDDQGSADARIKMFNLFSTLSEYDILFGASPGYVSQVIRLNGLNAGVENAVIMLIVMYGMLNTSILLTGLFFYMCFIYSLCERRSIILLGYFFTMNMVTVGFGSKNSMFCTFNILLLALFSKDNVMFAKSRAFRDQVDTGSREEIR